LLSVQDSTRRLMRGGTKDRTRRGKTETWISILTFLSMLPQNGHSFLLIRYEAQVKGCEPEIQPAVATTIKRKMGRKGFEAFLVLETVSKFKGSYSYGLKLTRSLLPCRRAQTSHLQRNHHKGCNFSMISLRLALV